MESERIITVEEFISSFPHAEATEIPHTTPVTEIDLYEDGE